MFDLAVNEVSLENMSNDEAVGVLRDAVQKPAPIKLVVAKCWDPSPRGNFRFFGRVRDKVIELATQLHTKHMYICNNQVLLLLHYVRLVI